MKEFLCHKTRDDHFDDSREEQFSIADKELIKYGFKGGLFIDDSIAQQAGYMTRDEVNNWQMKETRLVSIPGI
jgi:hypothetical protein